LKLLTFQAVTLPPGRWQAGGVGISPFLLHLYACERVSVPGDSVERASVSGGGGLAMPAGAGLGQN